MKIRYLLILVLLFAWFNPSKQVIAQGQEVCPNTGDGWIKFDNLNGYSFTYTADEGYLVAESCYKASTDVVYQTYEPPQQTVVITTLEHELSHVSVRVVPEEVTPTSTPVVTETPEPTPTSTPTVTETPEPTPTSTPTVTDTPEPTPTATQEITDTPEPTPTATQVITNTPNPTATPGDVITEVNTGSGISIPFFLIVGGLAVIIMITCGTFRKQKIG